MIGKKRRISPTENGFLISENKGFLWSAVKAYKHIAVVHWVRNPSWHFNWYLELWQIWFIWISLQSCYRRSADLV